jgi:hypothetical protein
VYKRQELKERIKELQKSNGTCDAAEPSG